MVSTLKRMGRPKKDEPTEQVRIPKSLVRRLRRLAGHESLDVGDLIEDLIDSPLKAREAKMLTELEREQAGDVQEEKPAPKKPRKPGA